MKTQKQILIFLLVTALFGSFSFAEVSQQGFSDESELGVILTGGNTRTQSLNAKQQNLYGFEKNLLKFNGRYLRSTNQGVENGRNWSLGLRYERELAEMLAIFLGQNIESDVFAGIQQRYNTDLGAKYSVFKTENFKWFFEGGYRYTIENKTDMTQKKSNYGRLYTEAEKAFNKEVSTKLWLEYLPNFTTSSDYQINTELSFLAQLNAVLSMKLGYMIRFDNVLNAGVQYKTDSIFTTALVAKF